MVDSHIAVPTTPGLGVTLDEAICAVHPGGGNVLNPSAATLEATYVHSRPRRGRLWRVASNEQ